MALDEDGNWIADDPDPVVFEPPARPDDHPPESYQLQGDAQTGFRWVYQPESDPAAYDYARPEFNEAGEIVIGHPNQPGYVAPPPRTWSLLSWLSSDGPGGVPWGGYVVAGLVLMLGLVGAFSIGNPPRKRAA